MFSQKHVSPKRSLVNPQDRQKWGRESDRSKEERKQQQKVEVVVSLCKTTLTLILF